MGLRTAGGAGPAAFAGRLLLLLLVGATAWLAATSARLRPPAPGAETTNWLAAHSLAFDHDELFTDADNFGVILSDIPDPLLRALAFAATVLVDVVHFERAK